MTESSERRRRPNFFQLWAVLGIAAPAVGAIGIGFDLATTVFVAVGGFVGAAAIATLLNWREAIASARWSGDVGSLGDMSGVE